MNLSKSLILISSLFVLSSTAHAAQSGEEIFSAKCSACHMTTKPTDMSKVVAPALMGVMRHLKMDYPDKTKAVAFIKDYALNPTKEKAICMPEKIKKFGLMPSQKGNITEEELEVVAAWMFDNFPPKDFKGMRQGKGKGKTTTTEAAKSAPTGKELLKANCASCHTLDVPSPEAMPTFEAPAMEAVLFHVKDAMKNDNKKVKEFIVEYAQNPVLSKSVCESNKVQKFGVMPSLKGKVSPEDLATIADYLIKAYPTKGFVKMLNEMLTNGKMNALKTSPFLMNQDALPHLTKTLIESWDKGTLNLTAEQKTKLLVVRTETMSGVKKIKMALSGLEAEIIEMTVDDEAFKEIKLKVDEVAKLKADATMIHLKCLRDSIEILNDEQMELLLPFWGV